MSRASVFIANAKGCREVSKRWKLLPAFSLRKPSANDDEKNGAILPNNEKVREKKYSELMQASTLSLAPMMEYTDRHFRHLVRLISSRTLLYTEMVGASTIYHERLGSQSDYQSNNPSAPVEEIQGNYDLHYLHRYLGQGRVEPLEGASVLQLGGSDPQMMYEATQAVMDVTEKGLCDYTAINLNCGCPSPKVAGKGCFGAALMDDPQLVASLTSAIHDGCQGHLPVTVKCRIGTDSLHPFSVRGYKEIDEQEEYSRLCKFVETVARDGVVTDFSIHARIAVLKKSFSPADNRKVPPLKYEYIERLVNDYPELTFTLNGGVETIEQVQTLLEEIPGLNGVMVGRAWAADPWRFAVADRMLYGSPAVASNRLEILKDYGRHADHEEAIRDPVKVRRFILKAIVPLFAGEKNSKRYRIALDELAGVPKQLLSEGKDLKAEPPLSESILKIAMEHLSEEALLRSPEDSYDMLVSEQKRKASGSSGRSIAVSEWQTERKNAGASKYEELLSGRDVIQD